MQLVEYIGYVRAERGAELGGGETQPKHDLWRSRAGELCRAAVGFGDRLHDGEAQTGAALLAPRRHEAAEQAILDVALDLAGALHVELHAFAAARDVDLDG